MTIRSTPSKNILVLVGAAVLIENFFIKIGFDEYYFGGGEN